jgi:NodT family efflux transporter outer membrane factor (OMF) lipoprotein
VFKNLVWEKSFVGFRKPLMLITLAGVGACSFAPPPESAVPVERLPDRFEESEVPGGYTPQEWWASFQDPVLDRLVDSALVANLDLAQAMARVEEARALLRISTADLLPGVNGSAGASRQDNPVNAGFGAIIGAILGGGSSGDSTTAGEPPAGDEASSGPTRSVINSYDASLGLAYELDFWGRARNDRKAAIAELQASASDFQVVQIGVLSETISAYFELLDLETRARLTEEVVDVLREREDLSLTRYDRGLINSFELYSVRQDRQSAQASLPQLRALVGEARRRLALVSGRYPSELEGLLRGGEPEDSPPVLFGPIPTGIPADLLWQRPDVRASGARLEASRLRVGARKAELLPSITLTGSLGLQSSTSDGLFDLSQWFSNLTAGLTQPLFQGGRLRANLDAARARYAQQLASHGQTVLTAVGEVETALLRHREETERYRTLLDQLAEAESSVSLQEARYSSGVGAYTDYLDALRVLLNTQSTLSSSARDVALARLAIHRALGGAWWPLSEPTLASSSNDT